MKILILLFTFSHFVYADVFLEQVKAHLENDPTYQEIATQYDFQKATYRNQFSELTLPSLDIIHNETKEQPIGSFFEGEYALNQLRASLSLFTFGSDWNNYQAAKNRFQAFESELVENTINRENAIITLLINYIAQFQTVDIRKQLLDLKQQVYDISKKRYARGNLSKNDLIKVEIDVSNAKSEHLISQRNLLETENQLAGYQITDFPQSFPWEKIITPNKIAKMLTWRKELDTLPQVDKLRKSSLRFEREATARKLSHLGNVSWNYTRTQFIQDSEEEYGWRTAIVYTLPIFEKFSRDSEVQLAKARAKAADTLYRYQKDLWSKQIDNSKKDLKLSHADYKNRLQTLNNSKALFISSTKQFKRGQLSVNELLVEQDRLLTTKILTNNAKRDLHLSYMNYYHSHGIALTQNKHAGINQK